MIIWSRYPTEASDAHAMNTPAVYLGLQPGYGQMPSFELYTLVVPVGEHPVGSTVSRQTLEYHGVSPAPRSHQRKSHRGSRRKSA